MPQVLLHWVRSVLGIPLFCVVGIIPKIVIKKKKKRNMGASKLERDEALGDL